MFLLDIGSGEWGAVRDGENRPAAAHGQPPLPTPHPFYFLDLPGYGYARAGKGERAAFRGLIAGALERPRLAGGIWLLDIRREPSPLDRTMQDLFAARGTRVLAAVTKSDKLPRERRRLRERELAAALRLDEDQVIVTSARTGEGVEELRQAVAALVEKAVEWRTGGTADG